MPYTLALHRHRHAAWAAGRAASVRGSRFKVQFIKELLEETGFDRLNEPKDLPSVRRMNARHRAWREELIYAANRHRVKLSHGVAAKVINVYLKAKFVCGGYAGDKRVQALHPPIDSLLLDALYKRDVGQMRAVWRSARWSKFDSTQYEDVISAVADTLKGAPLWTIEEHWKGYQ